MRGRAPHGSVTVSTMVVELYAALRKAGVDEATATAAAQAVWRPEQPATKADIADLKISIADLKISIADLKADLTWRLVLVMGAMTAILSAVGAWTR